MQESLKILLPIDFSRYSRETLEFALTLERYFSPVFVLVHVVFSGEFEKFPQLTEDLARQRTQSMLEAEAKLERLAEEFSQKTRDGQVHWKVLHGVPFKEICHFAEEENCRLIVIGTHGRTGLSHLLIGSTAERVVQHASCPVLSVKPRFLE